MNNVTVNLKSGKTINILLGALEREKLRKWWTIHITTNYFESTDMRENNVLLNRDSIESVEIRN